MKYPRKAWKENRGFGRSAADSCRATAQEEKINEILWNLTCSYDLADQATDMSIFQMDEAKGPLAGILRDLNRLVQEAENLLKIQANAKKAETEWRAQTKSN